MNGAGALKAFDLRTTDSTESGRLGGLLQASTYIAGLSGGSWLVGSIYVNNFTTVEALENSDSGNIWELGNSILEGPDDGGIQALDTLDYYTDVYGDVQSKKDAGFNISITDFWGRALSYQLINATHGGPGYTWSSIALMQDFQQGNQPFPIAVSDGRAPGEKLISLNATNYEFNPFEMGTWDPTTYGFVPTSRLGTEFDNGAVTDTSRCVRGFDNAGFVMGTSSSLFNQLILNLDISSVPSAFQSFVNSTLNEFDTSNNDIADYSPNPFYGYNPTGNSHDYDSRRLTLVDGGEDNQNLPLNPLIQPNRGVDVIIAVDSSADIPQTNWPNGSSLVASYQRSLGPIANNTAFPPVPDFNTFINFGLNTRPTFFGCNADNFSESANTPPLIVYIPNAPYTTYSNISTFQLSTNNTQRDAIILNGYNVATMANGTLSSSNSSSTDLQTMSSQWPQCLACAILSRSFSRTGQSVPEQCTTCFDRHCWDGTIDSSAPAAGVYAPTLALQGDASNLENGAVGFSIGSGWRSMNIVRTGLIVVLGGRMLW